MKECNPVVFIDTNVFLRVLVRDNEKMFQKSTAFLEKVKNGLFEAYTSSFVLSEVYFVLKSFYGFPQKDCLVAVESIVALPHLTISSHHNINKALFLAKTKKIKFTDCILASHTVFEKPESCIISYDRDFDILGIPRKEPE